MDAVASLLLYEHQVGRGLSGDYRPRAKTVGEQGALPLGSSLPPAGRGKEDITADVDAAAGGGLADASLALLGIITELPSRYGPEQLAASVGGDRVGLAGWIVDRLVGMNADLDEATAKLRITELCQRGLVRITPTRRLEASEVGRQVWQEYKR